MTEGRPRTADELKADIEATRAELAETADALAAKLDVKAQAKEKVHAVGDRVTTTAHDVTEKVTEKVTEDRTRTAVVAGVVVAAVAALIVWRARRS